MPRLVQDPQTGRWYALEGQNLVPFEGVNPDMMAQAQQTAGEMGPLGAAGMAIANAFGAGYLPESFRGSSDAQYQADLAAMQQASPWAYGAGAVGSLLPAAVATGGASIPVQAGVGAAFGALGNAQDPLAGAAMDAAGTVAGIGLFKGAGALLRGQGSVTDRVVGAMQDLLPEQLMDGGALGRIMAGATERAGQAPGVGARIASRIVQSGEANPEGRVLRGMLLPSEAERLGLALSPGDRAALAASNPAERNIASRIRAGEELRRTDRLGVGAGMEEIRQSQKAFGTDYVKSILGITGAEQLTLKTVGESFEAMGKRFDEFANDIGSVALDDQTLLSLGEVADNAMQGHRGQLRGLFNDVVSMTSRNNGVITAQEWQNVRTRLGKMLDAGSRQGDYAKISDAATFQEILQDAMEGSLGADARAELAALRHQYRIAKTLVSRPGVLDAEGLVNPRSFLDSYGARRTGNLRKVARGEEAVARTFETLRFLTDRIVPTSGTAERLLANPVGAAVRVGGGGALAAVGLNQVFGD